MSKFLEDELKMSMKHCDTCCCTYKDLNVSSDIQRTYSVGIQTDMTTLNCLRCNSNLNSPSHPNNNHSSYMKKLRSSDSVFSECNLSDYTNSNEQRNVTPPKKDDLSINPILSHHRMCERSKNMNVNAQRRNYSMTAAVTTAAPTPEMSMKNEQLPAINLSSSSTTPHRISSKDLKNEEIRSACNKTRNHLPSSSQQQQQQQKSSPSNQVASSNDLNGTKIFENFNKDLLKSIKVRVVKF